MSNAVKKTKKKKEPKKEIKKDLTPQLVKLDLAENTYEGIIREDHLGAQFLEGTAATYQWESGERYEGPFVGSQIEGRGKFFWQDGSTYEGELLGGRRHGEGTYVARDGMPRYQGQWCHGRRHGQGQLTYQADNSSYYVGQWQAGQKHGHGKQLWPSGNSYEGQWQLGKMSGTGTMVWRHGHLAEQYSGAWVDNYPHGEGTQTWMPNDLTNSKDTSESWLSKPTPPASSKSSKADPRNKHEPHQHQQLNNRYTGQWVWGKREGKGTFYYANGAFYHGEWKDHKKEGFGRHTFDDGKVYEGAFEADRMTDYTKPVTGPKSLAGLEDNPICLCTDLSDLEPIVMPSDNSGFPLTSGAGYTEPGKIMKGVYNMLLRHLGELRESYSRVRGLAPLLGDDPYVLSICQFWHVAREAGLLTPGCSIARFDRAISSGHRHHEEAAPSDWGDMRPLTPRPRTAEPKTDSTLKPGALARSGTQKVSRDVDESASQDDNSEDTSSETSSMPSPGTERNDVDEKQPVEEQPTYPAPVLGKKFVRTSSAVGGLANVHAPGRPLLFRQYLESFVRLALARFPNERSLEPQVQRLFKEQLMPSLKAAAHARPDAALQALLPDSNVKTWTNPIFGLFTQPQVCDVISDLEPLLWKIYITLTNDENAKLPGFDNLFPAGGIRSGAGGLRSTNMEVLPDGPSSASSPSASKTIPADRPPDSCGPSKQASAGGQSLLSTHEKVVRYGDWGAPIRNLHVLARLNSTIRVKDVLKLVDSLGLLKKAPPSKEMQEQELSEVLRGSEPVNKLLQPLGAGLAAEELAEQEGEQSEDEEGSGGSAAPEDDIVPDKPLVSGGKQLPGLAKLSFMPQGSLLGGPSKSAADDKKKKAEKDKKLKEKEAEVVRTAADDMACINLMLDTMDVIRILSQTLSPSGLDNFRWDLESSSEDPPPVDERVTILDFMETEVTFAEFTRCIFLLAELTTRRDSKFCRSLPLQERLETWMKSVFLSHLQGGTRYVPPGSAPSPLSGPGDKSAKPAEPPPEAKAAVTEAADADAGADAAAEGGQEEASQEVPKATQAPPPPPPDPEHWRGFDSPDALAENLRVPRRWAAGYEQEIAAWNY
eukprot:TRINITY_DN87667_c0_g1_i1.p1 TRINITY_DN87667_c0_g1~~TRINITY_DN87667_c0_g1_i1.p1  ORF type:complete len:1103 (+),score=193.86 TRINITY_DN87667_c0_g1_i1:74-3382(+)